MKSSRTALCNFSQLAVRSGLGGSIIEVYWLEPVDNLPTGTSAARLGVKTLATAA